MLSKARSVALLIVSVVSGCGAEPAPGPAALAKAEPAVADAGLPVIAAPPAPTAPEVSAHPIPSAARPPPPPPPAPPQKTSFIESTGDSRCRRPPGKAVAFQQVSETNDPLYVLAPSHMGGETAGKRIVEVNVGERPGSSVAWAVETPGEVVFGVRVPEYCGGVRPPIVTIRVTLPGGAKPIRALLCSVDPCNFGTGPRPP